MWQREGMVKKELFAELKAWSRRDDAFSLNDFLKEREITFDEFELIANSGKKFREIWAIAESRAWENLKEALFKKKIPRSRIAEFIREQFNAFQGQIPKMLCEILRAEMQRLCFTRRLCQVILMHC